MRLRLLFTLATLALGVFTADVRACWWCCCGGGGGAYYGPSYNTYGGWGYYPSGGAAYAYGDPALVPGVVIIKPEKAAASPDSKQKTSGAAAESDASTTDKAVHPAGYSVPTPYAVPPGYTIPSYAPVYYSSPGYFYRGYYYPPGSVYYSNGTLGIGGYYGSPGWYGGPYYNGGWGVRIR